MIKNKWVALIFRIISLSLAVAGILATPGEFVGNVTWGIFMWFTIQTNALAAILFAIFILLTVKSMSKEGHYGDSSYYPRFTMIAVTSILMMSLSYWIILAPNSILSICTFSNITTHGITPLLLVLDYALFTKPGSIKHRDVYYGTIFPLSFVIFTYIAVALGYRYERFDGTYANYPYFFFDISTLGIGMVSAFIAGILVLIILIGYILYGIDRKRGHKKNINTKQNVA